ncbi:MAG: hypothetical protein RBR28_00155 [Lentimicrobium sp.]|jgi:hypothetical protein|nr:hypothetical protein [Lentimicrobium sp.]
MKNILLKKTLWINTLRSFCAGIVWAVFSLFVPNDAGSPFYMPLLMPILMPFILLAFVLIAQVLKIFNLGGIGNILCMIVAVPGDPIMYLLHQTKPEWVPVKEYAFFNLVGLIYVYNDEIPEIISSSGGMGSAKGCPFSGSVRAEKTVSVLGFDYPVNTEIFQINSDWSVSSKGRSIGYIDKSGQIREGIKGDPEATLAPGSIIGTVKLNKLWVAGEMAGRLN